MMLVSMAQQRWCWNKRLKLGIRCVSVYKNKQVKKVNTAVLEDIEKIIPKENIIIKAPMSKYTTFRTGGEANALLQVQTEEQLRALLQFLNRIEMEYFILGNGSNLLISDDGYDGIIIQVGPKMSDVRVEGTHIYAQAGALLSQVAKEAYNKGLTGLEFASGIPGSIGGAVVMNAGAYGGEMKNIVTKVRVMSMDGEILELDNATMEFGYRTSVIRHNHFVVVEVELELQEGNKETINETMIELAKKRREKQPLEYPSAGSTFKRPDGYFAGKLLTDTGLKGYRIGDACVSEKHSGFIVNMGNATSMEIWNLIHDVQEKVYDKFGIMLEMEVICIGKFK